MNNFDPYAPPQSDSLNTNVAVRGGLDEGGSLVVTKAAVLPDLCLMTGQPAHGDGVRRVRAVWHCSRWLVLAGLVLLGVVFYFRSMTVTVVACAMIFPSLRFTTITCTLSRKARLKSMMLPTILLVLMTSGLVLWLQSSQLIAEDKINIAIGFIVFLVVISACCLWIVKNCLVMAKAHKKGYFFISGVHENVLVHLPKSDTGAQ